MRPIEFRARFAPPMPDWWLYKHLGEDTIQTILEKEEINKLVMIQVSWQLTWAEEMGRQLYGNGKSAENVDNRWEQV